MKDPSVSSQRAAVQRNRSYDRTLALMARRRPNWGMVYAGFERNREVSLDGGRWTICYRVHVHLPKPGFRASITVWPPRRLRATSRKSMKGSERSVFEQLEREARRHGYRGKWQQVSPTIRFGDFWKTLKDVKAMEAEIRRLDELEWEMS